MKVMTIDGEIGSGNMKLEMTSDGRDQIAKRIDKTIGVLVEVATRNIQEPFKFLSGDKRKILEAMGPAIRSRVLCEMREVLDVIIDRDSKVVVQMVARMSQDAMLDAGAVKKAD